MTVPITSDTIQLRERLKEVHSGKVTEMYAHLIAARYLHIKSPLGVLDYGVDLREIYGTGVDSQ